MANTLALTHSHTHPARAGARGEPSTWRWGSCPSAGGSGGAGSAEADRAQSSSGRRGSRGAIATCPEARSPPRPAPPPRGPEPTPPPSRPRGQPAGCRERRRRASAAPGAGCGHPGKANFAARCASPAGILLRSLTSPPSPDPAHVCPPSEPPPDPPRRLDSAPGKTSKRRIVGSLPTSRLGISGQCPEHLSPGRPRAGARGTAADPVPRDSHPRRFSPPTPVDPRREA